MVQVKIFGLAQNLNPIKKNLSDLVHSCIMEAFKIPKDKRFHRFFSLNENDFFYPSNRSKNYIIIEIIMFEGRSIDTKKNLIKSLFKKIEQEFKISSNDVEIVLIESSKHNWGIKGLPGNELKLKYQTNV